MSDQAGDAETCALIEKLVAHALRVFAEFGVGGKDAVIAGVGKSAEDFAYESLVAYLTDKRLKNKDIPYLLTALRNDIIDKLRSDPHHKTEHLPINALGELNPENGRCLDGFVSKEARPEIQFLESEYKDRVRSVVSDEPELREVVEAVLDLGELEPAAIANVLGIPATEVQVRKKRLKRRLIGFVDPEVPFEE